MLRTAARNGPIGYANQAWDLSPRVRKICIDIPFPLQAFRTVSARRGESLRCWLKAQ